MGMMNLQGYPIAVQLEYNDTPAGQLSDGISTWNYYQVNRVHYQELSGQSWSLWVTVNDQTPVTVNLQPLESGTYNLPGPQRFNTEPLRVTVEPL